MVNHRRGGGEVNKFLKIANEQEWNLKLEKLSSLKSNKEVKKPSNDEEHRAR